MNRTKLLGASVGVLALVFNMARAQADAAADQTEILNGLLGKSYFGTQVGVMQVRNEAVKPTGELVGLDLNLPIDDGFDYHLNFGFDHASKSHVSVGDLQIDNAVAYYYHTKLLTPYVSLGFGYDAATSKLPHPKGSLSRFFGETGAGIEVPVAKTTSVRVGVNYDQSVEHLKTHSLDYALSTDYWFNDTVGATLGATLRQGHGAAFDALYYVAGVRFDFD